ncbi:hypothetical protein HPB47_024657, partial [Ixodes persulcatus]
AGRFNLKDADGHSSRLFAQRALREIPPPLMPRSLPALFLLRGFLHQCLAISDLDRCAVDWPCRNLAATLTGPFVRLQLGTARSRILTRRPSLAALVNENVAHEEGPAGD